MRIDAGSLSYQELGERIRGVESAEVHGLLGQRYIAAGTSGKKLDLYGTPGNALGAYLDGGELIVHGNAQDAAGDTMNAGTMVIHGSCGDTTGYAMRGGEIYVKGDAGCRVGVHMKEYGEQRPVIVVGGSAGAFLGEYLAGGMIIVLNLDGAENPVGPYCGTGMHGGKLFIRSERAPKDLPAQVSAEHGGDLAEIVPYLTRFAEYFGYSMEELTAGGFYRLLPNSSNPYKQLYAHI